MPCHYALVRLPFSCYPVPGKMAKVELDWYTKRIVGSDAGVPCTARYGLASLGMAVSRQFPEGARDQGFSLMSDHGCQPTALAFMKACGTLGIPQAFTNGSIPCFLGP